MSNRVFIVQFVTAKTNFCYLSLKNSEFTGPGVVLKVIAGDGLDIYLTALLGPLHDNVLGISPLQAKLLSLNEGDDVMVSVCRDVPTIKKLAISPVTVDDYEILDLLAQDVEATLLDQICVVAVNQKVIIWISKSLHLIVNIDSINPVSPGLLDNLTELEVKFPKKQEIEKKWSLKDFLGSFFKTGTQNEPKADILNNIQHPLLVFRLHPIENLGDDVKSAQPFNVYVMEKHLPKCFSKIKANCDDIYKLTLLIRPTTSGESFLHVKEVTVRLVVLENSVSRLSFPTMYVNECIFKNFNLKIGSKALLGSSVKLNTSVTNIEIITTKDHFKDGIEQFKAFLGDFQNVILNSDLVLNLNPNFVCSLKFIHSTTKFCLVTPDVVRNCKFRVAEVEVVLPENDVEPPKRDYCENFGNFMNIFEDSFLILAWNEMLENILLVGKSGSGKTSLTKTLCQKLSSAPNHIYTEEISCKNIKGKSLDSLQKLFVGKFENLIFYQPSVLILDDLHVLCEATSSEDEVTPEALQFNRVSEMLAIMLEKLRKGHRIAFVATCESTLKLNRSIFASRGQQLFKIVFNIEALTKEDRSTIITYLFAQRDKTHSEINVEDLSIKTEGFVFRDLVDLVDKAIFESIKEESDTVTKLHCEAALESTTSLSLKDVNLHSPGERDFSDIGGMDEAKKVLIESMMWPVQYPNLFNSAPLRLQSGLLLYGPPGTGKTILAGAAAKQCGLRLISIKGPELLSKYIGASEEAVRNVFDKAQSAKPCILFFDEFDSLAPRRGHDSTGVTDRVVNQLLTQLDGVESLSGVCVLAASSRPDLLDPALLRPGRLDKQIFCDLPDKETRHKILKVLSKKLLLAPDCDLSRIAEKAINFSGADLQSLLYTAQLAALGNVSAELGHKAFDGIQINQNHLDEALKNTRPSLTKDEDLKYKQIYSKFHQKSSVRDMKLSSQKATLA